MQKHPNEFTRQQIRRFFADRHLEVKVVAVENSYVIFLQRFSLTEACNVDEPAGRVACDEDSGMWTLFWMSGCFRWLPYDRYPTLSQALAVMLDEQLASLFRKVL